MSPPRPPPPRAAHRRPRTGRGWTFACVLLLGASVCARHHGQQPAPAPAPDPSGWRLTLPATPTFSSVWTLSVAPEAQSPARPPEPEAGAGEAGLRARLAAAVKNGRLVAAAPAEGSPARTVTFRPLRRGEINAGGSGEGATGGAFPESPKPPGPLEDAALASAVRSRIAAEPDLGRLNVAVTCQSGAVSLRAPPAGGGLSLESTAALADLALTVEPVGSVQVELPELPGGARP